MGGVAKTVKKVFKKVAPVVLPIALGAIPSVGPIMAATMGSGIGTLIQGGSFKQALMAGAMGAAFSGGITSLASKFGPVSLGSQFAGQSAIKKGIGTLAQKMVNMTGGPLSEGTGITGMIGKGINKLRTNLSKGLAAILPNAESGLEKITSKFEYAKQLPAAKEAGLGLVDLDPGSVTMGADLYKPGTNVFKESVTQGILPKSTDVTPDIKWSPGFEEQLKKAKETITPQSFLSQPPTEQGILSASDQAAITKSEDIGENVGWWGKSKKWFKEQPLSTQIAIGLGGAGATYAAYKALTPKEIEETNPADLAKRMASIGSPTDPRYVSQFNPTGMYSSYPGRITQNLFAYDYPTAINLGPNLQPWTGAAKGGIMNAYAGGGFPRRTGQINGPGTGTSDDVPAMLSDGEFVMTAQAVRNAGGGSRAAGARRMYNLMNNLERGVA